MRALTIKLFAVLSCWCTYAVSPVWAHVKWFLNRPESELLKQPKPSLFTQLSVWNILPISLAAALMFAIYSLNSKFSNWSGHNRLIKWAKQKEPSVNLFMAICLGVSLIYCGLTRTLLVPNFVICSHCPQWLPAAEMAIGSLLILGLFSRLTGLAVLWLIYIAICKHGLIECLDALPIFGLAIYFVIAGRNRLSLDYVLAIDKFNFVSMIPTAHSIVRWTMGLGLIILALDEKLLHPQLAMDLLLYIPHLNPLHGLGLSNDMFILVSGLVELLLGVCVFLGCFPRISMLMLLFIFSATTMIFCVEEFFGHASCYGIILSIMLCGVGSRTQAFDLSGYFKNQVTKLLSDKQAVEISY